MLGSRKWQLVLVRLVLAQALVLQAVLPSWGHLFQPSSADAFSVLCRVAADPQKAPDGSLPRHHDCTSCCLAALTGGAVPVADDTVVQLDRRFVTVTQPHRDFEPERDGLSSAWSARGPPLAV